MGDGRWRPVSPRRARVAAGLLASLIGLAWVAATAMPTSAHGAATQPGSRTYLCRLDGTAASGDIEPSNPACAAAVAQGGKQPLWDWFGVLPDDKPRPDPCTDG